MAVRDKAGQEMSLAALRQSDPYISSIVDVTGHVALYRFSPKANEWEKTDVEGTLFVYTRSAFPHHGFTIMNRLNMHNLVEPVNKDLEFQLHDPFLLYRNSSLAIYSIWFYDKSDCQRIAKLMTQVVQQELERAKTRKSPSAVNGCTDQPIDILEMLSKAKNEYEQGQGLNDSGNGSYSDKSNYKKADSLETSENSASTQEKAGHKHLTVEELFGTSLPKEQPASCFPSLETRDRRHQFYAPAPHEQPKPVVVKAGCATFNAVASDFSHPACMAPAVFAHGTVPPQASQTVANLMCLSPSLGITSAPEALSSSLPLCSCNPPSLINALPSAPGQVSPLDRHLLLPTVSSSSVGNSSHSGADLLHKLKLIPHTDQLQTQPLGKASIAPKFSSVLGQLATPESFKGGIMKPVPSTSLVIAPQQNVVDKKESDILPQPKCLTKVVSATPYVTPMSTVGPSVLMSPSVFHPSVREETARMSPIDSALSDSSKFVLQRSQLQETLIRFIKTDSGFLNSLHDVYLQLYAKSADNGKL
ncbi:mRNA-decapping enzyme 1A isoform X1 [Xenopus laevis]|uniref:5'-(N(7)-methylguanosine 5'-triphospho)-[mRNA] hydrolase n=1 Tax=Xenopus laevis TaxID=8355 RepID=A0A8J1N0Z7_XENLA|nr:mRNA-decapping enzyme 1A isoform X1 [Xenopus laevis]